MNDKYKFVLIDEGDALELRLPHSDEVLVLTVVAVNDKQVHIKLNIDLGTGEELKWQQQDTDISA